MKNDFSYSFLKKFVENLEENEEKREKIMDFYEKTVFLIFDFTNYNEIFYWCVLGFTVAIQ